MKKINLLVTIVAFVIGGKLSAQMKFTFLNQSYGTSIMGINKHGKAISGGAYYDFATNTFTPRESFIGSFNSINDNEEIAGATFLDEVNYIFQPAYKKNNTWTNIPWFQDSDPKTSQFTPYKISPNGKWVVGQMSIGEAQYGMFIYNTETSEMKRVIGGNYQHYSAYGVNNAGIIVGWADLPQAGTQRMPVWVNANDLIIHEIRPISTILNAANAINENNIIVGVIDNKPFYYNLNTDDYKSLEIPEGAISAELNSISENGYAVGYARITPTSRRAIIYHPDLGNTPIYLNDWLISKGVTITSTDSSLGTASAISSDGNYVAGFTNASMAAFANGWVVYLNNEFPTLAANETIKTKLSIYPNPTSDVIVINTKEIIEDVSLYDITGKLINVKLEPANKKINLRNLASGTYILKVKINNQIVTEKIIKK